MASKTLRTALSHSVVPQDASLNSLSNLCTAVYQLFLNLKLCRDCQEGQRVCMPNFLNVLSLFK